MSRVVFEEVRGPARFNPTDILSNPPFPQSYFYGEWQRAVGRGVRRFIGVREGKCIATLQLVRYPLIAGRSYLYAPYGPVVGDIDEDVVRALRDALRDAARGERAVFVRLDFSPPLQWNAVRLAEQYFRGAPRATYHSSYFQPRAEWALDCTKSDNELLRAMHHNTRYSIRAAERRGVRTEIVGASLLPARFGDFFALMRATAARNGFELHPRAYYEAAFQNASDEGNAFLVFARYKEIILAAHFILLFGRQANFVFGGSSAAHRECMGSYAAQWAAIREARARGAAMYNFGGVTSKMDPREQWEGLSRFKRKFGGVGIEHGPFYDLVLSEFWYDAYIMRKLVQNLIRR